MSKRVDKPRNQGFANIQPSHFFKALKSPRRLANTTSLNDLLAEPMKLQIPDPYTHCAEPDDWDLYAVPQKSVVAGRLPDARLAR